MKYADAVSFRRAMEARLNNAASIRSTPINRLRRTVVLERYLARLLEAAPDRWLLKGGVALEFRFPNLARATKDLDLWMREREETATDDLISATEVDLHDFFVFTIERMRRIENDDAGAAVRYRLRADMAGREFETAAIDIAIGSTADEEPELLTGSNLLAFAEIEPVCVPALSLDRHVAEKLHAYTRMYASESQSSRVKDLIDLVLISRFAEFRGSRLRTAIERTFDSRGTHPVPAVFSQPPPNWERTYARLAADLGIDNRLQAAHQEVARFLDPVLAMSLRADARWNPTNSAWNSPEPAK